MQRFFTLTESDKEELLSITGRLKNVAETTLAPQTIDAELTPEQVDFAVAEHLPLEFFQFFEVEGLESSPETQQDKAAA